MAEKKLNCWHEYGYTPGGRDEDTTITYGIDFVISELERFSNIVGFTDFKTSSLYNTLANIKILEEKCISKNPSFDNIINNLYALNGALAHELNFLIIKLCHYIENKDLYMKFDYTKYSFWSNPCDMYQKFSETIKIDDEFDKLLEAVALYNQKVNGIKPKYTNPMKSNIEDNQKIYSLV